MMNMQLLCSLNDVGFPYIIQNSSTPKDSFHHEVCRSHSSSVMNNNLRHFIEIQEHYIGNLLVYYVRITITRGM